MRGRSDEPIMCCCGHPKIEFRWEDRQMDVQREGGREGRRAGVGKVETEARTLLSLAEL